MKVEGKLIDIQETQQISDTFRKRTFVLEYIENPQYPEYVSFELIQDRCEQLDGFEIGQEVEVNFNLKGRKWVNPEGVTKYFNALQAWRIEAKSPATSLPTNEATIPANNANVMTNEEDDLPF